MLERQQLFFSGANEYVPVMPMNSSSGGANEQIPHNVSTMLIQFSSRANEYVLQNDLKRMPLSLYYTNRLH